MSALSTRLVALAAVAGVVAALGLASPAYADGEVDVDIRSLDSSMTPGGEVKTFQVRLSNEDNDNQYFPVRVVFTIQLDGLKADDVRIANRFGRGEAIPAEATGPGQVTLRDPLGIRLGPDRRAGSQVAIGYAIRFVDSAPGGRARVTASAVLNGDRLLGSDNDEINVRGERQTNPPTTEPPATTEPAGTTAAEPTFAAINEQSTSGGDDSGTPTILYILGALLVAAGGVLLWLLFRRPRPALVDGGIAAYGPATDIRPARLSHPVFPPPAPPPPRGPTPPTSVMPAVNQPYSPQHAVDPWAGQDDL